MVMRETRYGVKFELSFILFEQSAIASDCYDHWASDNRTSINFLARIIRTHKLVSVTRIVFKYQEKHMKL